MKRASAADIRRIDEAAIRDYSLPGLLLMENAGRSVSDVIFRDYPCLSFHSIKGGKDSPDSHFLFPNGSQDSPNLSSASIDRDWDRPNFSFSEIDKNWD